METKTVNQRNTTNVDFQHKGEGNEKSWTPLTLSAGPFMDGLVEYGGVKIVIGQVN